MAFVVAAVVVAVAALSGCGRRDALVVYISADETVARPLLEAFTARTGIAVAPVFDTEATKTTGLAERLRAEANRPRADVFWSSEIVQTIALADDGVLAPVESDLIREWPAEFRDPEGRWYAFAARARVIVYAPSRVRGSAIPERWTDLLRESHRGRVVMADPRFGTTRTHMGVLAVALDRVLLPGAFGAFLEGLSDVEMRYLTSGNAGVVEAVASGEADFGMTDTDDVWAAQARGLDVALVYPRHAADPAMPGGGTLLIPNTVGVVAGTTHPEQARAFVEFLLSPEGEAALAASASRNIPLGPRCPATVERPGDPLRVDWRAAAAATDAAVERAITVLSTKRPAATPRTDTDGEAETPDDREPTSP